MQLESKQTYLLSSFFKVTVWLPPNGGHQKTPKRPLMGPNGNESPEVSWLQRDIEILWRGSIFFWEISESWKKKMMRIWRSILSHIWSSKKRSRSQTRGFQTTEDRLGDATLLLLAALLDWPCWSIMPALVTWLSGLAHSNLQTLNVHNLLTPWVV